MNGRSGRFLLPLSALILAATFGGCGGGGGGDDAGDAPNPLDTFTPQPPPTLALTVTEGSFVDTAASGDVAAVLGGATLVSSSLDDMDPQEANQVVTATAASVHLVLGSERLFAILRDGEDALAPLASAAVSSSSVQIDVERFELDWDPEEDGGGLFAQPGAWNVFADYPGAGNVNVFVQFENEPVEAFQHTGRTNGTTLYYVVTAEGAGGEGPASIEVAATPQADAPGVPKNPSATSGDGQVTVDWDEDANALSYNLYWSTTAGVTPATGTQIAAVTPPFSHTGLTNGSTVFYVVTAVDPGGETAPSAQVGATPAAPVAGVPQGLRVTAGDGAVRLTWDATEGAFFHNLYWDTAAGVTPATGTKIAGTSGITKTFGSTRTDKIRLATRNTELNFFGVDVLRVKNARWTLSDLRNPDDIVRIDGRGNYIFDFFPDIFEALDPDFVFTVENLRIDPSSPESLRRPESGNIRLRANDVTLFGDDAEANVVFNGTDDAEIFLNGPKGCDIEFRFDLSSGVPEQFEFRDCF
jgi:hypothetical protein